MTTPIVALDYQSAGDAENMISRLGDRASWFKVGNELFTAVGPGFVRQLTERGASVFLDLKFHDIPNTVAGAMRSAVACGARLATVHATGGRAMLEAAVKAGAESPGNPCKVLAVTVLTSLTEADLQSAWGRERVRMIDEVLRLADAAAEAGAHGIVCSGHEVEEIARRFGDRLAPLVPGVRLAGDAAQDQARVVTPGDAARRGASYVVIGRTVTAAADPAGAMSRVLAELAGAR